MKDESKNTAELLASFVGQVVSRTGLVLAQTREALLKDFLEEIQAYLPDVTDPGSYTFADFERNLEAGETPAEKFIVSLFARLGYDFSTFENNRELIDNIKSVIATTISLSQGIKELFDGQTDWMAEAKEFMDNAPSATSVSNFFADPDLDLDRIKGLYGSNVSMGGVAGKILAILRLVLDLVSLIRKFRDMEWKRLQQDDAFSKFLSDSFFTQKFAERIFDHILTVMLRNAKEVFADDLNAIIDNIGKIKGNISEEVKRKATSLRTEIQTIEAKIKSKAQELGNEAEVSLEWQTQLKIAKGKLEKLAREAFGDYGRIGEIFSQIYAVLDLLQVIKKETVEVAAPSLPAIDAGNIDALIRQAHGTITAGNKDIGEISREIENIAKNLKSLRPTSALNVIRWSNLEELCTDPIGYFKKTYPLKDYDDAEALLTKIFAVVRSFNSDIPDFGSLKQLLYEFLVRIKDRIKDLTGPIREKFAKFESFITDLLKVLETFAVSVKKELTAAFNSSFGKDSGTPIGLLKKTISDAIGEYKDSQGKLRNFVVSGTNIKFKKISGVSDDYLKNIFADSFIRTIGEKAKEYDLFLDISPDEWRGAIEKAIKDNQSGNLIREYKSLLGEIEKYVTDLFDQDKWEALFDGIIADLKEEFIPLTKGVPNDFQGVKDLFTGFDFSAYFTGFSNKIKGMVPYNPDIYYVKFREITFTSVKALLNSQEAGFKAAAEKAKKIGPAEYEEKLKTFAADVFAAYWPELKKSLHKTIISPIRAIIEKAIKDWITKTLMDVLVLPPVVAHVQKSIAGNFNSYGDIFNFTEAAEFTGDAKKIYDEANEKAVQVTEAAKNLLFLIKDAEDINSWKDGLRFAFKLYRIIPPVIKSYIRELIDLPKWNFENVRLPDYKLDVENKFFAVTIYEYPGEDGITTDSFEADVSIRLVAFVGDRKVKDAAGNVQKDEEGDDIVESGLYFLPVLRGKIGKTFPVGDSHQLALSAATSVNSAVNDAAAQKNIQDDILGFFFTMKNGKPAVELLGKGIEAYLKLAFQRKSDLPLEIFKADIAEMTIKDYPQELFLGYKDGFDCGYLGGVRNLLLTLRLREINDFFAMILKNDIKIELEKLELGYSLQDGFRFNGAYKLHIPIDTKIDLKVIKFRQINLELGSGDFKNIEANLLTNFTVDFGGIAISFPDMGFGMDINYMKPGGGFGDLDFSPRIRFPSGLGIAIDVSAVKGAGLISWNKKKEEFFGLFELNILEMCSVGGFLLFNMKMPDGTRGFSFMGALSVSFTPGIQLGMGFSLTGIGGSLGINRGIDIKKLREAVRNGSLNSIMFIENIKDNMDFVLANITSYYPLSQGQMFFGFLAKITWGEILKGNLGLFVQAPAPIGIYIAGSIKVSIADALESLLVIQVDFIGGIEFDKGLFFDASVVNSHIVGVSIYGDISLRIYWGGSTKGFLLSAGGFHPLYKPHPGFDVGEMKRLGMKLNWGILKLSLEAYFAITSNSVQFGANLQIVVGWEQFGLSGYLYFDVLFQFNPFMFSFMVGAGLAVKIGKLTLFSIKLSFELNGPARWNAKGTASFWFLCAKIPIDFDITWGKKQEVSNKKYIEIYPLYSKSYEDNNNWEVIQSDLTDNLVVMDKIDSRDLVMQPSDRLSFTQHAVPLNQDMARYGEAYPGDMEKISLRKVKIAGAEVDYRKTVASFAPSLIRELDGEEGLHIPSYENMEAGFVLATGFGMEKGAGEEITPKIGKDWQKNIAWERWLKYASDEEAKAKAAAKTPVSTAVKKTIPPETKERQRIRRETRTTDSQRLAAKTGKTSVSRVSFRRTETGFKRYIRELDQAMNITVDVHDAEKLQQVFASSETRASLAWYNRAYEEMQATAVKYYSEVFTASATKKEKMKEPLW